MLMSGSAEDKKHNQHFTLFIGDFLCHVLVHKVFDLILLMGVCFGSMAFFFEDVLCYLVK